MKIYLSPATINDSKLIIKWRNSPKIRNHCFDKRLITEESHQYFFEHFVKNGKYKQFIVNRIDDDYSVVSYPIATIYLKDVDAFNKRCELCLFTSDDEDWNTESQRIAIKLMLEKAFNEYGMRKVYSYVFIQNTEEIELLENAGFRKEAVLFREALDLDGNEIDAVRMSIYKEDYSN